MIQSFFNMIYSKQVDAIRLLKKILEQDYLEAIIQPLIELQDLPPILLQYGSKKENVHLTRIFLIVYICKFSFNITSSLLKFRL